ncbi:SRPBCC family protein [Streptomyces sp. BH-SS-21]|uniref:SRPBCC family protein n=1 Tax=Streptomyces liliiviolaceus TaxID=2823109 RepID=A0A940Y5M2_9ACTN|nr:SRPBCC family protein [Streptomyces liliiviolaceus]MBQ0851004.1 SRPBCC family protein [Streptomyces liliiviolaceus]
MFRVEETIEVAVPVSAAYNQWTQFKSFPRFMTAVKRVEQVRPALLSWTVGVGPVRREFQAEIVEQEPDSHLTWQSLERHFVHQGEVLFRPTATDGPTTTAGTPDGTTDRTTVVVRIEVDSPGATALLGGLPELVARVVQRELRHFKAYIEGLGAESGAWRGTIHGGRVRPDEPKPHRSRVPHWPVG